MVQTAERYGRVLQVGSQHQSEVGLIQMAELARNGRIGEVRAIYNSIACARGGLTGPLNPQPVPPELDYDLWLGPAPYVPYDPKRTHYNWRFAREFGTGEMGNWGGHSFAAINLVLGTEDTSPVEVRATAAGEAPVCGSWQKFQLEFVFANGVRALINHGPGLKAVGTKGWITRSASEPASVLRSRIGASEIQLRRAVGGHMGDWFDCIRTRQQPTAPARAGHRAATMAHLANICLDLGRPLKYDPVKEEFPGDAQANRKLGRLWRAPWVM
jgi:predicted dehydrogenase